MTTHGGTRPGAGRPPLPEPRHARTVRLTDAQWAAFKALGGAKWLTERLSVAYTDSDSADYDPVRRALNSSFG